MGISGGHNKVHAFGNKIVVQMINGTIVQFRQIGMFAWQKGIYLQVEKSFL